jgi:hypothetical protein
VVFSELLGSGSSSLLRQDVRTSLFSMQQQHMLRQYVRKWLLRQHARLAMCLRLRECTLNTANQGGWQLAERCAGVIFEESPCRKAFYKTTDNREKIQPATG